MWSWQINQQIYKRITLNPASWRELLLQPTKKDKKSCLQPSLKHKTLNAILCIVEKIHKLVTNLVTMCIQRPEFINCNGWSCPIAAKFRWIHKIATRKTLMRIKKSPTRTMKFSTFGAGKKVLGWGWPTTKTHSATMKYHTEVSPPDVKSSLKKWVIIKEAYRKPCMRSQPVTFPSFGDIRAMHSVCIHTDEALFMRERNA